MHPTLCSGPAPLATEPAGAVLDVRAMIGCPGVGPVLLVETPDTPGSAPAAGR